MSDFHDTPIHPVARKVHNCIACYYPIAIGERYTQQSGFYDGRPYRSRYHPECFDSLCEDGELEFTPGFADPPERVLAAEKAAEAAAHIHTLFGA